MTMQELVEMGRKQGYLDYKMIEKVLLNDIGLMDDQIKDIVAVFLDLSIEVRGRPVEPD